MANVSVLKNVVSFTGLTVGVPASLPHLLQTNGVPVLPGLVAANAEGFTITANTVNITVTRQTGAAAAVDVYAEHWHSIEEAFVIPGSPAPFMPFIIASGGVSATPGVGQAAEFVQHTQGANASIAPGAAVLYTTNTPAGVFNTLGIVPVAFGQGTAFPLAVGNYLVDFENSADAAWSLAIAKATAAGGPYTTDVETIAGASTATTWIHGRAVVAVAVPTWIIITPVTGTQAIPTAGTAAGQFIARITILKIA